MRLVAVLVLTILQVSAVLVALEEFAVVLGGSDPRGLIGHELDDGELDEEERVLEADDDDQLIRVTQLMAQAERL